MFDEIKKAIRACHWRDLDDVAKHVTQVWSDGELTDDQASYLFDIVQARRSWKREAPERPVTVKRAPETYVGTRPISARSLPARRMLSRETFVRADDTKDLTNGEAAVLTIVTEEIVRSGACRLCVGKLAALAGVSRRWAQHALRKLATLAFVVVEHRPIERRKHDTNVVTLHPARIELAARLARVKTWWRGRGGISGIGRSLVHATRLKRSNSIPLSRDNTVHAAPSAPEGAAGRRTARSGPDHRLRERPA